MAKKAASEGPNKSELIRDFKKKNPTAKPKAIVEQLNKEHGLNISAQFVSTVLTQAKKRKGTGKRGRPAGSGKAKTSAPAAAKLSGDVSLELLRKANKLATELGGVAEAKKALEALSKILG